MSINDIRFIKGQGGLGRALPNLDHVSGLLLFSDNLPSGFASDDRIKSIFSLDDAEQLGILDDYSDETKATGGDFEFTVLGSVGDIATCSIDGGELGSYTLATGDTLVELADGIADAINANTVKHGFVAVSDGTDSVSLTAPDGLGASINATGLAMVSTGTTAATVTQFSSGVGSFLAIAHYHISEFFRMQPKGKLYVGIYDESEGTTYTGSRIQTIQDYAEGEIRQIAVFNQKSTYASSQVSASQTYADINDTNHKPHSVILHSDFTGLTLAGLASLSTLDSEKVSVCIGDDGNFHMPVYSNTKSYLIGDKAKFAGKVYQCISNSTGNSPYENQYWAFVCDNLPEIMGYTVSSLGTLLGTIALTSVHENIGWVQEYNLADGFNHDEAGFVTGELYKNLSTTVVSVLNDKQYVFIRKHFGLTGTWWDDSFTATAANSDYLHIENNRTMDKSIRGVRVELLPNLSSPLYVNEDGTLSEDTISEFKNEAEVAMERLLVAGEISAYEVNIDPAQDVLTSSKVVVSIKIVPVGVAREIEVKIGYVVKIA